MSWGERGQITEDVGISPPAINVVTGSTFARRALSRESLRSSLIYEKQT